MKSSKSLICISICIVILVACRRDKNYKVANQQHNKDSLYSGRVLDTFAARMRERLLFLANLEGYLTDTSDDYFIIYTINDKDSDPAFFSIRVRHHIASITFSKSHFDKTQLQNDPISENILDSFSQKSYSIYRPKNDLDTFITTLDHFKKSLHAYEPAGFSENITYVSYFDGKEHYTFSSGTVGFTVLDQIDSLFQKNALFKNLKMRLSSD